MSKSDKLALPLRIDTDAFVVTNTGIVLDASNELVAEYATIDEAEVFVAKANGVDVASCAGRPKSLQGCGTSISER